MQSNISLAKTIDDRHHISWYSIPRNTSMPINLSQWPTKHLKVWSSLILKRLITSPAEQSWFSRQSAQRAPSLHRFCPPRKSGIFVLSFFKLTFVKTSPFHDCVCKFIFNQSLTSYVAERVGNSVALASHRVRSLPGKVSLPAISFAIIIMMGPTCHKLGRWRGSLVPYPRKRFVWTRDNRGQSDTPTNQRFGLPLACGLFCPVALKI